MKKKVFIIVTMLLFLGQGIYIFKIKNNLWTKLPNAKVYKNGEFQPDIQVYTKDGDYFVKGFFVYPKLVRFGIGVKPWEIFGYLYTPGDYRSHLALSGTAKLGGSVKIENNQIKILYYGGQPITICLEECE